MEDYIYSPNELLEMALKIEEDGVTFYSYLARNSEDRRKKEVFSYLASQEEQHFKDFKRISTGLLDDVEPEFWDEASKYIRSLVHEKIFPNAEEMIERSKNMTLDQILNLAIGIEKETAIFYEELFDLVKSERSKEILSRIIRQEIGHVRKLSALKE